jgi:threonine dehydratase
VSEDEAHDPRAISFSVVRAAHERLRPQGAGAAGLAGLVALREELAGKTVAVVLSGANIDAKTLRRVLGREV